MKFIILAAVIGLVAGEAPAHVGLSGFGGGSSGSGINEYVDEALLARIGELIARGGDGSGTPQGTDGLNLDSEILTRVSASLGDDSGSSGPSSSYGPPSRSSSMLGQPEPAMRIAEFELTDTTRSNDGGYGAPPPQPEYGAPAPAPEPLYGAPEPNQGYNNAPPTRSQSSGITLGRPMAAQRVADFAVSGGSANTRQGYN